MKADAAHLTDVLVEAEHPRRQFYFPQVGVLEVLELVSLAVDPVSRDLQVAEFVDSRREHDTSQGSRVVPHPDSLTPERVDPARAVHLPDSTDHARQTFGRRFPLTVFQTLNAFPVL